MNTAIQSDPAQDEHPHKPERLLRLRSVELKCEIGRSTIYRKMAKGTFPKPRRVEDNTVRWRESEIDRWIEGLPFAEDEPTE